LTSYTHSAVDNILLKIRNDEIGILRLGAAAKIHPEVRQFATLGSEAKDSIEELEKSWMEPLVVATTCLTINHPLFNRRVFDYCIVDEASQITLPVCLGPIRMANTFVLVGDHYQLPPLVQNKEACEGGLDVSLFKLLCESHPEAVVSLEHQYRMCADIMLLSNTFIYSGRLKCGTTAVASRQLTHSNPNGLATYHHKERSNKPFVEARCASPSSPTCWLSRALDPASPVIFINTDAISTSLEFAAGSRINALEAKLVAQLTVSLLSLGIPATEVGVIAFYRSQLALLRSTLQATHTQTQSSELAAPAGAGVGGVELHTADRFQGRDKEVVLVSCVRSNENGVIGDLLKDRRRVNVALTRARSKLVILGSERTLSSNELLGDLVGLCRDKGWVLDLDHTMLDGHAFDETVSQTQALSRFARSPLAAKSPTPQASPSKKRRALGDVTTKSRGNARNSAPSSSPEKKGLKRPFKVPRKVVRPGMMGLLEGRPVLSNVFGEAM
jgi:DNA replication ATP-dependent helicase Dna2